MGYGLLWAVFEGILTFKKFLSAHCEPSYTPTPLLYIKFPTLDNPIIYLHADY